MKKDRTRGGRISSAEFGEDILLHDSKTDAVHVLNNSAKRLLALHKEGKSPEEMEEVLKREFSVPPEESLSEHILRFLEEIEELGLA